MVSELTKAILVPSGDHAGDQSHPGLWLTSIAVLLPSVGLTKISALSNCASVAATYATFDPSRESAGMEKPRTPGGAISRRPAPSGAMNTSPFGVVMSSTCTSRLPSAAKS
jgi:hypothetical protein